MTGSPYLSLQHREAIERFATLEITSYDVALDLAADEETFGSRTTIVFESTGAATFVDVKPARINEVRLNGAPLDPESLDRGRLALAPQAGTNELVVDAVMRFRTDGEGLHRSVDPADGRHYVYGMSFMDAAPSIFACFDQPDLKAPYTFHVQAPPEWTVIGNAPGRAGRARGVGVRADAAAVDLLRHAGRRAVARRPDRARRDQARPDRSAEHRRRRSTGTPRRS